MRQLIINADDYGLTPGIDDAICDLFEAGVLTSTTALVTWMEKASAAKLKKVAQGRIGLHFSLTTGKPVSDVFKGVGILTRSGMFKSRSEFDLHSFTEEMIREELDLQLDRFRSLFGEYPSHIDSHHHIHKYKKVYDVLSFYSERFGYPLRKRFLSAKEEKKSTVSPHTLFYRFNPAECWTVRKLRNVLRSVREGVSELIVHPGYSDRLLKMRSSFNRQREIEFQSLLNPQFMDELRGTDIRLISYAELLSKGC